MNLVNLALTLFGKTTKLDWFIWKTLEPKGELEEKLSFNTGGIETKYSLAVCELGMRIYHQFEDELLQNHRDKYFFVIPSSQTPEKKHLVVIANNTSNSTSNSNLDSVIQQLKSAYPNIQPYVLQIGNIGCIPTPF